MPELDTRHGTGEGGEGSEGDTGFGISRPITLRWKLRGCFSPLSHASAFFLGLDFAWLFLASSSGKLGPVFPVLSSWHSTGVWLFFQSHDLGFTGPQYYLLIPSTSTKRLSLWANAHLPGPFHVHISPIWLDPVIFQPGPGCPLPPPSPSQLCC